VQFVAGDVGRPFNGTQSNGGGNRNITNANGNTAIVFTAPNRDFANDSTSLVPSGSGAIVAYVSDFNGTTQLLLRNIDGVKEMTGPRFLINVATIPQILANPSAFTGKAVTIENVQFKTPTGKFNGTSSNANGSKPLQDCQGNEIICFTSSTSPISNEDLPAGNGTVEGVISIFGTTVQISFNSVPQMPNQRCTIGTPPPPAATLETIANVRALHPTGNTPGSNGSNFTISQSIKIRGVVTSNRATASLEPRSIYFQDASGAIVVRFAADHTYDLGDELEIVITGETLSKFNGLLQVSATAANTTKLGNVALPAPQVITMEQLVIGNFEGRLVRINGVNFTEANGTLTYGPNANRTISNGTANSRVFTRTAATFSTNILPSGTFDIIGLAGINRGSAGFAAGDVQLVLRNPSSDLIFP